MMRRTSENQFSTWAIRLKAVTLTVAMLGLAPAIAQAQLGGLLGGGVPGNPIDAVLGQQPEGAELVAELNGTQQIPPNASEAVAEAEIEFFENRGRFNISMHIEGLSRRDILRIRIYKGDPTTPRGSSQLLVNLGTLHLRNADPANDPLIAAILGRRRPAAADSMLTFERSNVRFPAAAVADLLAGNTYISIETRAFRRGEIRGQILTHAQAVMPGPLADVPVPRPENLDEFVKDEQAAKVLGKLLFWEMQVGSDGATACASCHYHAGADVRFVNTVAPNGGGFGVFRGANVELTEADFPFHEKIDPAQNGFDPDNVKNDTSEVVGSQGVLTKNFVGVVDLDSIEDGLDVLNAIFNVGGINVRQVTGRNTPSAINAVFQDRQFWDGRANRFFNGVNPFGDTDPSARVWEYDGTTASQTNILLDNASLASQAVGPPGSDVEMIWKGRPFADLGKKLFRLRPLGKQMIDSTDSLLGNIARSGQPGVIDSVTYDSLIRQAFHEKWWGAPSTVDGTYTQMEANFSLFWGLSIMLYESTLVSDDTPFDRFAAGDKDALTAQEKEGLEIFLENGMCIECHSGAEFTAAATSQVRGALGEGLIEIMAMENGPDKAYDNGFYNIGVRPTEEDLGVGASGPFGPFSLTLRRRNGINPQNTGDTDVPPDFPTAVNGAFKTPTIRNVELNGPYMHNGGMRTLEEVVEFYARGTDFENAEDKDPDVDGIGQVRGDQERIDALVAFMKALTDDRVRHEKAPFDHPQLFISNGHGPVIGGVNPDNLVEIPATGAAGGPAIRSFEEVLRTRQIR